MGTILKGAMLAMIALGSMVQPVWAARLNIQCPAGSSLNDCVAQACANPEGGDVYLGEGVYDANLNSALNLQEVYGARPYGLFQLSEPFALCEGGVSIIGQGTDETILISNGPNTITLNAVPGSGTTDVPVPSVVEVSHPVALGIGNAFGALGTGLGLVEGPSEIRDLTVRCEAVDCPIAGVGINSHSNSGAISNVRVEGFLRGLQFGANNGLVENNTLLGLGATDNGPPRPNSGRGIFVVGENETRYSNINISHNHASGFARGITVDSLKDFKVTLNTFVNVTEGMLVQLNQGPFEVSHNKIDASGRGIITTLNDGNPEGSGDQGLLAYNLICGAEVGFSLDTNTDLAISKNVIMGTPLDSAFLIITEDPSLDDVTFDKNKVNSKAQCSF